MGKVAPNLLELIGAYLFVDEGFWNCFEERLASFDADNVIDHAEQFLVSYGAEDWRGAYHHDFEYEIGQIVDGLSAQLHTHFAEWIRGLQLPQSGSLVRCVDPSARFLSFNYTSTLQTLYDVSDANVLHIHGRAAAPDDQIVLGHGWKRSATDMLRGRMNEDTDTRVAGGYELIDDYFAKTFKPTQKLVDSHRDRFDRLSNVSEVIVLGLGHSLADVDAPYFHEIVDRISSATWTVSCYQEPSLEQTRLAGFGVPAGFAEFARLALL